MSREEALINAPHLLTDPDFKKMFRRYGNMYTQYKHEVWWFNLYDMLQKVLLTGGLLVVSGDSAARSLVALLVIFVATISVSVLSPFSDNVTYWVQMVSS